MNTPSCSLGLAACALIASTLMAAAPHGQSTTPQPSGSPTDDPAAELFGQMCSTCHDVERVIALRRTKSEWQDVLTKMIGIGATGSESDFEKVFGFLRRHYGKVYINAATADEMTTTLGLSAKDADAIAAYRKANGPFQDFEAVKKVPGHRRQDARSAQRRGRVLTVSLHQKGHSFRLIARCGALAGRTIVSIP